MIEVSNIEKRYKKQERTNVSLELMSFKIDKGDILGVFGPHNSGKTTLVKMLAGLIFPTSGSIRINDVDLYKKSKYMKEVIGYVPEKFGEYENLKVFEYLDFYAGLYRIKSKIKKNRIEEILKLVKLEEYCNLFIDELTNEQLKMLSLARSLLNDPEILVLDEFFSEIDNDIRSNLIDLLETLKNSGKIIIFTSSVIDDVVEACTYICILEKGKIRLFGDKNSIINKVNNKNINIINIISDNNFMIANLLQDVEKIIGITITVNYMEFEFIGNDDEMEELLKVLSNNGVKLTKYSKSKKTIHSAPLNQIILDKIK